MRAQLEEAARAEEEARRELAAAGYELETAESQRRQAEDEVLRLEGLKNHYEILLGGLRNNLENLDGELTSLTGRIEENLTRAETARREIAEQERLAEQYRAQVEERLSGQSELLERSGALSEEISSRKSRLAGLSAEKDTTVRSLTDLRSLWGQMSGDQTQKQQLLEIYRVNIADAETEIARRGQEIQALRLQSEACHGRLTKLNEEKIALEAERTAKNRAGQEMNETLLNLERAASRLDQKIAAAAMFLTLDQWRQPEKVLSLAGVAAFSRTEEDAEAQFSLQRRKLTLLCPSARIFTLTVPGVVDISSTELRARLKCGGGGNLLAPAVYGFILREGLYETGADLKHLPLNRLRPVALSYLKHKRIPHGI